MNLDPTIEARFWAKVDRRGPDECWLWRGALSGRGYGNISFRGKVTGAHRVSFILDQCFVPPADRMVCHRCDTPACVNPSHLFLGTNSDNMRDCVQKGRFPPQHGHHNPQAVLTTEQVGRVRAELAAGKSHRQIAQEIGVNRSTIDRIASGESWRDVRQAGQRRI